MYKAGKQLSAIDWNFHTNLPNAKTKSGVEMMALRYQTSLSLERICLSSSSNGKIINRRLRDTDDVRRNVALNISDLGNIAPTIARTHHHWQQSTFQRDKVDFNKAKNLYYLLTFFGCVV